MSPFTRSLPDGILRVRLLPAFLGVAALFLGSCGSRDQSGMPSGFFFDRVHRTALEFPPASSGEFRLRSLVPEPAGPQQKLAAEYETDRVGDWLIVLRKRQGPDFLDETALLYQPNTFKGYDLIGYASRQVSDKNLYERGQEMSRKYEETLNRWRAGERTTSLSYDQALMPAPGAEIGEILVAARGDRDAALSRAEAALAKYPDSPLLMALALDLELLGGNSEGVDRRLAQYEPAFLAGGQPVFVQAPPFYRHWLEEMEKDREGRNLFSALPAVLGPRKPGSAGIGLEEAATLLSTARYNDSYFLPNTPYLLAPVGGVPNFLPLQVQTKCMRVLADFCLLRGDTEGALDWLYPAHRAGTVLSGKSNQLIGALIGIAVRQITTAGLTTAYLNGLGSAEEIKNAWPRLDEAYQADLAISREAEHPELTHRKIPGVYEDNYQEHQIRHRAAHARMALLHTAAAVRHRFLSSGDLPSSSGEFGPLLPGGPDPDPFLEFQTPLRTLPEGERPFMVYSVGPDRTDQQAAVEYDPTNGTISAGDLSVEIPRTPKYPFPPPGRLATTRDGILAQFPNGLPPDPFANLRFCSYTITATEPACILSWGPDTDQQNHGGGARIELTPIAGPPPPGQAVSMAQGQFIVYPDLAPEVPYDPTNGTVSEGDLFFCTGGSGDEGGGR